MSIKIIEAGEVAAPAPVAAPASVAPAAAPTPSETILRAAVSVGSCTGATGRTYGFRKLGPLDRMLIAKALGGDLMMNGVYASYAFVACSISEIDGTKTAMPSSTRQVEALVQRIGEDWDALNTAMRDAFNPPAEDGGEDDESE